MAEQERADDPYEMLYCDDIRCRVNTFERGYPSAAAACPGCGSRGLPIPRIKP